MIDILDDILQLLVSDNLFVSPIIKIEFPLLFH